MPHLRDSLTAQELVEHGESIRHPCCCYLQSGISQKTHGIEPSNRFGTPVTRSIAERRFKDFGRLGCLHLL
ncbi:hypothetical protein FHS21_003679 [Phyllobacterium trifolii]|uniref:Uncharacterized protein n=1 Tax=Phyllobacterium trifolii TaxID=300193 RepID=A0A839UBM3_9HYPH|nr:hypothetical protein [Phyllobacterium trifolii]